MEKLEDIASKEYLNKALRNAVIWCKNNLHRYVKDIGKYDYSFFKFEIDNNLLGGEIIYDYQKPGLFLVSTNNLLHLQNIELEKEKKQEERFVKINNKVVKFRGGAKVDPESLFVKNIVIYIINTNDNIIKNFPRYEFPGDIADDLANQNRKERGLSYWPGS